MEPDIAISVVIPTIPRRRDYMRRCLEALAACEEKERAEILVVTEEPEPMRDLVGEWSIDVRTRVVPGPEGAADKRNAGAIAARGDILSFLDDDTEPEPGYLRGLRRIFESGADAVGGRIVPSFEAEIPPHLEGRETAIRGFNALGDWRRDDFFIGCNIAFRRSVFETVGLFSRDFGRLGRRYNHGDESEFVRRVRKRFEVEFAEEAGVRHAIQPHRMAREYMVPRAWRAGRTGAGIDEIHRPGFWRNVVSVTLMAPVLLVRWCARPGDLRRRLALVHAIAYALEGMRLAVVGHGPPDVPSLTARETSAATRGGVPCA